MIGVWQNQYCPVKDVFWNSYPAKQQSEITFKLNGSTTCPTPVILDVMLVIVN